MMDLKEEAEALWRSIYMEMVAANRTKAADSNEKRWQARENCLVALQKAVKEPFYPWRDSKMRVMTITRHIEAWALWSSVKLMKELQLPHNLNKVKLYLWQLVFVLSVYQTDIILEDVVDLVKLCELAALVSDRDECDSPAAITAGGDSGKGSGSSASSSSSGGSGSGGEKKAAPISDECWRVLRIWYRLLSLTPNESRLDAAVGYQSLVPQMYLLLHAIDPITYSCFEVFLNISPVNVDFKLDRSECLNFWYFRENFETDRELEHYAQFINFML